MYTICYIVFFVLSTLAAFKNDTRKLNALYQQQNTVYSAAFYYSLFTQRKCKNRIQLLLYPALLAESEGFFGVLPYSFASLRSLTTDFQTVHRTVFIGKADRPCSNPLLSYQQKNKGYSKRYTLYSWRRVRDSNPRSR